MTAPHQTQYSCPLVYRIKPRAIFKIECQNAQWFYPSRKAKNTKTRIVYSVFSAHIIPYGFLMQEVN